MRKGDVTSHGIALPSGDRAQRRNTQNRNRPSTQVLKKWEYRTRATWFNVAIGREMKDKPVPFVEFVFHYRGMGMSRGLQD